MKGRRGKSRMGGRREDGRGRGGRKEEKVKLKIWEKKMRNEKEERSYVSAIYLLYLHLHSLISRKYRERRGGDAMINLI